MKRHIFTMLLALILVFSLTAPAFAAETEESTGLSLAVTQGKGSVVIAVYLQGCEGVTNGRFTVGYDAEVLTLAQAVASDACAVSSVNSGTAGEVSYAWVGSQLTAEKTLMLTLTLETEGEITKDMTYTAETDGIYADTQAVEVSGAAVTIAYTPAADTTALKEAVAEAEALVEADYTADSYAAVKEALAEAVAVLADADATQEEVDAAAKKLNDAIAALVAVEVPVDTTELEKAIKKAEGLKKSNYTAASYANMEKALKEAKTVLADADATQEEVDAAAKKLNDAIAALKEPTGNNATTGDDSGVNLWLGLLLASGLGAAVTIAALIRQGKVKYVGRFLSIVLVAAMVLTMAPVNALAAVNGQDMEGAPLTDDPSALAELVEQREGAIVDAETEEVVGTVTEIENPDADLKLDQQMDTNEVSAYADTEVVRVIVELEGKGLLEQGYTQGQIAEYGSYVEAAAAALEKNQEEIARQIAEIVAASGLMPAGRSAEVRYNYTIAMNGIAVMVPYGTLPQIRLIDGVKGAYVATRYEIPEEAASTGSVSEPNMYATSETFGSAQTWTELGYTGQGMKIAIVDTGLDTDHPSFADAPEGASLTLADVENVLTELNAYRLFGQTSAVKLTADKLYYSEKVPFGFNYVDRGLDITHDYDTNGDHGTHVAGISAANKLDTTSVVGVAPDAQLVIMKVFGQNGGAYSDDIIAAIEDCLLLDVDVVNMSLGAPAGFTEDSVLINEVYGRILETDMILAVAAGNSNSAASGNSLGTNVNLTQDPDNGLVNSPSTYLASTIVASLENVSMMMPYFTVDENKIAYVDVNYNFTSLAGDPLEYVMIPNYGRAADYTGLDVTGRVAVVSRGGGDDINFMVKQENAYRAGAVALVVYDNTDGELVSMYDAGYLPNVFISKADGAIMKEAAGEDGIGSMTVMTFDETTPIPSSTAGELSDFSCWGVTPDLQLAPDVTAPGGNIYSCYMDGHYGTMSGTSMACPHIAGMAALVLQYLHDQYPDMTGEEYHIAAESLIMCTAVPVYDTEGILYSPRKQGAGSANVHSAVTSPVYLTSYQTATGEQTPKASLGDDPARTGVFTFSFDMHNLTGEDQTYMLDGVLLTDQYIEIDGREFMSETGRNLTGAVTFETLNGSALPDYDADLDGDTDMDDVRFLLDAVNGIKTLDDSVTGKLDIHEDGILNTVDAQLLYLALLEGFQPQDIVVVPANSSITVNVTVTLSAEDKAYMEAHYANGIYVDGFVRAYAQSEGAVDLSLPLVGFYGDWTDARMFDTGWYYEDEETVEYNRYLNVIFATLGPDENSGGGLGMNPYVLEDYDPAHNVLSPNGDYYYDYVNEIYVSMLRSAELLDFTWTDDETGEELFYEWYAYARKSYYWPAYGMCMPIIYTDGGCQPYTFYDENGNLMVEDLQKLTLTIRGYLDDGDLDSMIASDDGDPQPNTDWADEVIEIPVVIDLAAPKLDVSSIVYSTEDGRNYITFDVEDNYDIAAVVAMTMGGGAYEYVPVTEKTPGVDGEKATIKLDITGYDASFQLVLCDYGCNESYYELSNVLNTGLTSDKFFAYRRYSTPVYGDSIYATDQLNGWYSFETAEDMTMHTSQPASGEATVYAAEYIDGYIIGAQGGGDASGGANTLFVTKAGGWDRMQLGSDRALNFTVYEWPGREETYFPLKLLALDMAFDYTTDTLYLLANGIENNYFPEGAEDVLLKVDYLTGEVTLLGVIEPEEDEPFLALTLACDNDGNLYTVNYENGKMYTIDKTPSATTAKYGYGTYTASCFSTEDASYYPAAYTQSMTVDHETNRLYWAAYQGKIGQAYFFEVDKDNGELISITSMQDNAELSGLFKPYDSGRDIIPAAELSGLVLNKTELYLNVGNTATITAFAEPFSAELGSIQWSSADESVAAVTEQGIVEARGIGSATITASCGGFTAQCSVNVSAVSGTLYAHSGDYWMLMDAGAPYEAVQITDTQLLEGTVKAAAYFGGALYVAAVEERYDEDYNIVYSTNLYKLDPSTLYGSLISSIDGNVTALAVNYDDGFLYGLTREESYDARWNMTITYDLVRVHPGTGAVGYVTNLDAIFPYSDTTGQYNACSGALAIDYEGNFYVSGDDWETYNDNVLVRFNLSDAGEVTNITTWAGFSDYSMNGDSMVWSERNGGIIHVVDDQMEWIDVSDMENVITVDLGTVRGAQGSVYALAIPLNAEPELPEVAPTAISLEESYEVANGEQIKVLPAVEPWNATAKFLYTIGDETIATVDEEGNITGHAEGETTITVTVEGTELSATAAVVVVKNPGYLYGFFQADIAQSIPLEYWGKISLANTANSAVLTDLYDFTIYAASFSDGFIYACGQSTVDGLYYMLKISPSNFSYEVLNISTVMIRDMAFDYTTGAMYVTAYTDVIRGGLYMMDMKTGELTFVGDNDLGVTLVTLAADDQGRLFAADADGHVYEVNKHTVSLTDTGISSGTSQYLQAMTYDYNNDAIYWVKGGQIYLVDPDNGTITGMGTADIESGEMYTVGCVVSGLFSVPNVDVKVPETVAPSGIAMDAKNTVAVGETLMLDVVVLPVSVATVDQTITWRSGDETIATVDASGVITGVAAGEVTIYATDASGNTAECKIVVTQEHRYFYGYDELSRSWVSFDFDGEIVNTWAVAEGLSPIVAAQYIGETLYAYDAEGYFYTVDTETFQRTLLGSGINGLTTDMEANDSVNGLHYVSDVPYQVIDMTYSESGEGYVAYAVIMAYSVSEWLDDYSYKVVEISLATGEITNVIVEDMLVDYEMSLRPTNLIYRGGYLYTVNGYISGMVTRIALDGSSVSGTAIFAGYWGDFNGGRSLIEDPMTGKVYAVRDMRAGYVGSPDYDPTKSQSELVSISLGVAYAEEISEIGSGLRITGMFIK